jgi:predicted nucleic acid-binding Zn ribbon protein
MSLFGSQHSLFGEKCKDILKKKKVRNRRFLLESIELKKERVELKHKLSLFLKKELLIVGDLNNGLIKIDLKDCFKYLVVIEIKKNDRWE